MCYSCCPKTHLPSRVASMKVTLYISLFQNLRLDWLSGGSGHRHLKTEGSPVRFLLSPIIFLWGPAVTICWKSALSKKLFSTVMPPLIAVTIWISWPRMQWIIIEGSRSWGQLKKFDTSGAHWAEIQYSAQQWLQMIQGKLDDRKNYIARN